MATDFSYGGKQNVISGPIKPNGKDMPGDARTRVDCYADIASIPNPYVGLKITVKVDETNNNKMTDYIVKSLKANSIGVANTLIDEVVRYVDYLGVNSSGGETSTGTGTGLTSEQSQQLTVAYNHSQSVHVTSDDLLNIDAISLNGKKFSEPMTKVEYDAITSKDVNTIYLVTDEDSAIEGIPSYSSTEANKVLAVNGNGTALAWIDAPSGSGNTSTIEIINDLTTGGTDKALSAEQGKILKNEVNTVISDYLGNKKLIYLTQTEYNSLTEEEKKDESVVYNITDAPSGSGTGLTSEQANQLATAYNHSQTTHVQASDIPTKTSELENDSNFITSNYVDSALSNAGVTPVYSILKDKKWVVIGDSISDTVGGRTRTDKFYQEFIAENTGCTLFNWGGNGTGYYTEFNGVSYIYNRINEIPEDADLITIFAGTNDKLNVGNYGDTDFTSFYGAVDKTVSAIKEKFPLVPLGLITPLPRTVNDLTNAKNKNYSEAIKAIGKKYSVPVLDLYADCGFHVNNNEFRLNCLPDGLHPNINGHAMLSKKIQPWLENVVLTDEYTKYVIRGMGILSASSLDFTSGGTKEFTIALDRVPNENQGIVLQSTNTSVTISPSTIYFNKTAEAKTITLTIPSSVTASFTINAVSWNINIGSITFSNNGSSSGGESEVTLSSITAEYTQGSTAVYPTTNLDSLKNNLVVKANYSDNSQTTLSSGDYSLSGTLSVGSSTITVTYSGKTTTFTVNVIKEPEIVEELTEADYLIKIDFSDTSQSGKLVDSSGNNNSLNLKTISTNVLSNGELVVSSQTNCGTNLTKLSTPFEGDSYSIEFAYKQEQDNGSTLIYSQAGALTIMETGSNLIKCMVRGYTLEDSTTTVWGTQGEAEFTHGIYNHFVFTITKTNIKLYTNGVLSKTVNMTSEIDRFILNEMQILSWKFQGSVNTFNIIKKEITSDQVSVLYNNWHIQ